MRIERAASLDPEILKILRRHPLIDNVEESSTPGIQFNLGSWHRSVLIGDTTSASFGIIEVMDNNPIVCADQVSVPTPASTLALIGLAPLINAGLLVEEPVLIANIDADEEDLSQSLSRLGWREGVVFHGETLSYEGAAVANVLAEINPPENFDELDELFRESYGRSFFIREDDNGEWDIQKVIGTATACYRLRISPGERSSLLTIQLMSDKNGKVGAGQAVHAMNVMCGYEESLSLA